MKDAKSSEGLRFQRARTPRQKAARAESILAAGREILRENPDPWALTLGELAHRAGMAKSNIYRYFPSLEAVLLGLLGAEWEVWAERMHRELELAARSEGAGSRFVPGLIAREMAARPLLCHLQTALPTLMERNVPVEAVQEFKHEGVAIMSDLARAMHDADPTLSPEGYGELMRCALPLMAGIWPLANPQPAAREAMDDDARLVVLAFDFERDLGRGLELIMRGLEMTGPAGG